MFRSARLALVIVVLASGGAVAGWRSRQPATAPPAASASAPGVGAVPAPDRHPAEAPAKPADKKADTLVILAGGDVNLGRGAGQEILRDPAYDPFSEVKPLLQTADLRFVNLESQLSDQHGETERPGQHLVFTGPPGGADVLARAGINVVSLANNHAWDYGKKALFETMDNLDRAHVAYAGASREPNQQYRPVVLHVKGWSVALFAVTQIWNQPPIEKHEGRFYVAWASFDALQKALAKARRENDIVLVAYHGGAEYVDMPMQWTRAFVHAVMGAGVDALIGSHPHVPHGVGWTGDRPAFYSLGNLVFAMHSDFPWTGTSFFARLTFHRDGTHQVEACPYFIMGHTPTLFSGKSKPARERAFKAHLSQISVTVGRTQVGDPGEYSCMPLEPPAKRGDKERK